MAFLDSLDIANRACQHIGAPQILRIDEDSTANTHMAFAYDKLREAELRRNVWRFAIRHAVLRAVTPTTMLLKPAAWSADTMYQPGAVVADANLDLWTSATPENLNNVPGQSLAWDQYFGPVTVSRWTTEASYYAGELVYKETGDPGAYVVFLSLENTNGDDPEVAQAWDIATTFGRSDVVTHGGFTWYSLLAFNTGNEPAVGPAPWDEGASYGIDQLATGSDGYVHKSLIENNQGNDPVEDDGSHWENTHVPNAWSSTPQVYASSPKWLPIYAALERIYFTGVIATCGNLFRLPANYLRIAPQDPKAGSVSFLGAPSALDYTDWVVEGEYIVSRDQIIPLRFVADITVVSKMDAMFCEGLAARMGIATCEPITQSASKKQIIAAEYSRFMSEARMVNGIETGAVEPPEDEWISCRR